MQMYASKSPWVSCIIFVSLDAGPQSRESVPHICLAVEGWRGLLGSLVACCLLNSLRLPKTSKTTRHTKGLTLSGKVYTGRPCAKFEQNTLLSWPPDGG